MITKHWEEVLLSAPVLSEEEIRNIENIGKEFKQLEDRRILVDTSILIDFFGG